MKIRALEKCIWEITFLHTFRGRITLNLLLPKFLLHNVQTIDKLGSILDRQHLELQWHFALELGARQVLLVRSDELWTFTKQLSKQILRAGDLDYTVSGEGI